MGNQKIDNAYHLFTKSLNSGPNTPGSFGGGCDQEVTINEQENTSSENPISN